MRSASEGKVLDLKSCMVHTRNMAEKSSFLGNENERDIKEEESQKPLSASRVSMSKWPQIILSLSAIVVNLSASMSASHSAIVLPQLQSGNSSITLDEESASWLASSYAIVGPAGCFFGGIAMEIFGRRKINLTGCLGMLLGWVVVLLANNNTTLIIARIIEGFAKGMIYTSFMITLDETADPKYRGTMMCACYISASCGILIIAALGAIIDWWTVSAIASFLPIISLIICFFIDETSTWLVRRNRIQEARLVLKRLWGQENENQVEKELQILCVRFFKEVQTPQNHTRLTMKNRLKGFLNSCKRLTSPHILKPFIMIHVFNTIQVTSGYGFFLFYSVDLLDRMKFNSEGSYLDGFTANVILSAVRVFFTIAACICMFRIGRRPIAIVSGLGSFICASAVTIILYIINSSDVTNTSSTVDSIVFTLVVLFTGFYAFGLFFLPTLMIGETQPAELRGIVCGYIFTTNDIILGIVIQNYYTMLHTIELKGMFLMFSSTCLLCTVFSYLFLPETQGKTLLEVEKYFHHDNILWITRKRNKKENDQEKANPLLEMSVLRL